MFDIEGHLEVRTMRYKKRCRRRCSISRIEQGTRTATVTHRHVLYRSVVTGRHTDLRAFGETRMSVLPHV